MTLEQLRIFVKVVDAGSFSQAAELLGLQRSNVSRSVAALEAELKATLLERTTRRQSISEAGRAVYERAVGVLAAIDDTLRVTQNLQATPRGLLRLTCSVEFGMTAVGRWVELFLERYPHCTVEAEFASRSLDLVHEGFDLAIWAGPLQESRLAARQLGHFQFGLYASPRYAAEHGLPGSVQALESHPFVLLTGKSAGVGMTLQNVDTGERIKWQPVARLKVNTGLSVCSAVVKGLGIGMLPDFVATPLVSEGKLMPVMAQWRPPSLSIYAVFPSNRYLTPKVRAFIDLAVAEFVQRGADVIGDGAQAAT